MADYDELIGALRYLLTNKFAPKPAYTRGLLGDGQGNVIVPGKPDRSYVRFNRGATEYFEIFNRTVNPVNGWPVLIGEFPWQPGLTQVVDTDWSAFEQSGWGDSLGDTSPHAPTHEWPPGAPGSDPLNVYTRALVPLRAYTLGSGTSTVYVNSYEYEYNLTGTLWGGLPGVDMTPVMGATATGTMRYAGVYLDPLTNTLGVVTGTTTVHSAALDPPLVDFPGDKLPSARVRIYGGQAAILEADMRDARRPFNPTSGAPVGVDPTGHTHSKIVASDGAPDPALSANASGYIKFDTKVTLDLINTICDGRLTLTSGTPVTTADVTAAATIYFTPYGGNRITVYDGTNWILKEFTEKSVAVPATTATPFDVFIYDNAGTLTLETTNWTNDTTRATVLTTQDGVYVKSGATTRRYLGTCRTTGVSGQTEDSLTSRFVWNYYNRVNRLCKKTDSTNHTYATAAWRYWNNASTNKFEFIVGIQEEGVPLALFGNLNLSAAGLAYVALGYDTAAGSTVDFVGSLSGQIASGGSNSYQFPVIGYHYVTCLQYGNGTNTTYYNFELSGIVRG